MKDSSYRLRWLVDVHDWDPSALELKYLLHLLPQDEQQQCNVYRQLEDRKRALVSRLLQRSCASLVTGLDWDDIVIKRTKGRKPYIANRRFSGAAQNFNYNVSHEGRYVALVSEPLCVCGVDIAAPEQLRKRGARSLEQALATFKQCFSNDEWSQVNCWAPDADKVESCFQKLWSLKEAFVKARGDGLGFEPLSRACFTLGHGSIASLKVDGTPQPRWGFFLHDVGHRHWISVARGPPEDVVDAFGGFKQTFLKPYLSNQELEEHLAAPEPPFMLQTVEQLLSEDLREDYQEILCRAASIESELGAVSP